MLTAADSFSELRSLNTARRGCGARATVRRGFGFGRTMEEEGNDGELEGDELGLPHHEVRHGGLEHGADDDDDDVRRHAVPLPHAPPRQQVLHVCQ